jgi:murein DD-endopeptidase MepM/ murein hydrolase activator NlpD
MKIDPKLLMSPQQSLDEARVRSLKEQQNQTSDAQKLEEVAEAFEGIFVKMLLDRMPEEDPEGIMSSGFGGQMFKGMLHSEYANLAANRTNFGIADAILRQLQHQSTEQAVQPVEYTRVSSDYGMRADPFHGHQRHHSGIDFAAPLGTPVKGVLSGRVMRAGPVGNYGNLVEIRHSDGRRTRYGHLDEIKVEVGQWIERGQVLGTVGQTGRSTGPHLHFELREGDHSINPAQLLKLTPGGGHHSH